MKKIKLLLLIVPALCLLLSCSKEKDEADNCEDSNITKVTYSNTTNASLRIVVSTTLNAQFEPVNPLFSIDLAAGQSVVKEFEAGRYVNSWYNGCPSNCNKRTYNFKDYGQCNEYEEKQ